LIHPGRFDGTQRSLQTDRQQEQAFSVRQALFDERDNRVRLLIANRGLKRRDVASAGAVSRPRGEQARGEVSHRRSPGRSGRFASGRSPHQEAAKERRQQAARTSDDAAA
jgi:hypothetical protein